MYEPILGYKPEHVQITNSEMQSFKDCRRKWWLSYYLGLKAKEKSLVGPLPLGSRVHNALEAFYTTGVNPVDEYERLQRIDNAAFLETPESNFDEKVNAFNSEADLGRIMLEGYLEWLEETNADSDIEVLGAEQKLSVFPERFWGRVEIMGKVDMRVKRRISGFTAIMDHKTSKTIEAYNTASMSEQLMLYVWLEQNDKENGSDEVDGGIYNVLKKVKRTAKATPPFYQRIDVRFNKSTLESFEARLYGTVDDIMTVRDKLDDGGDVKSLTYPRPSNDCSWKCPFFKVCTMFDDGSNYEAMLEDQYEQINPNQRYENNEQGN